MASLNSVVSIVNGIEGTEVRWRRAPIKLATCPYSSLFRVGAGMIRTAIRTAATQNRQRLVRQHTNNSVKGSSS